MLKKYIDYLKDNPKGYWFKRKLFGWGWTPATWQGWAVTLGYLLLIILFAFTVDPNQPIQEVWFTFLLPVLMLTVALITIAYKKGEKPKWQWGIPKKNTSPEQEKK